LQFFDIRQLLLAGRHWRGLGWSIACPICSGLGQQLAIKHLGTVTPQGQLATAGERDGHGAVDASDQLLASKHTITVR
jgi:hypothetical protein